MKLLSEKVSAYFYHLKIRGLNRKIENLTCLAEDLRKEAQCDPERKEEYNDSIDSVQAQVGLITEELQILTSADHKV